MRRTRLTSLLVLALAAAAPRAARAQAMAPLQLFFNSTRGDNYSTATADGRQAAQRAGYSLVRQEACVFTSQEPGTVPLYQFWSAQRGDNMATTSNLTGKSGASANTAGYTLVRIEGYVYPTEQKGTVAIRLYYNTQRHDNFTTATTEGANGAQRAGYTLVSVIGYAPAAAGCQ